MSRPSSIKPSTRRKIVEYIAGGGSKGEASKAFGISRMQIYRILNENEKELAECEPAPPKPRADDPTIKGPGKAISDCWHCGRRYYRLQSTNMLSFICSQACYEALAAGKRSEVFRNNHWYDDPENQVKIMLNRVARGDTYFAFREPDPKFWPIEDIEDRDLIDE